MQNEQKGHFRFHWRDSTGWSELNLHNRTWAEALKIAQESGYKMSVWYRSST